MVKSQWITHARILTPLRVIADGCLQIQEGVITALGEMREWDIPPDAIQLDAQGLVVAPGWIDAHTHGGHGYDYMDCTAEEAGEVLLWLASTGVTGVLPTLASASLDEQKQMVKKLVAVQQAQPKGAAILGLHLEGPYFNMRRRGAQPAQAIRPPAISEVEQLWEAAQGQLRLVTLAPEEPEALEVIRWLTEHGVTVSCGHSEATLEQFNAAVEAGLNRVAHTFNGMPSLHHREPGILGGAFANQDVYCELILDGVHVHPLIASLLVEWKSAARVVLITDATQAAGLEEGIYIRPGNRKIIVKDGEARLESGSLAGSVLTMQQAVKNVMNLLHLPLESALQMASSTAAESLGLAAHKGTLEVGKDADLLVLQEDGTVLLTVVKGQVVYQAQHASQDLRFSSADTKE